MKDQFYIVLPSNSSMQYFADNTTTQFVTKLPREIQLLGDWEVALTEIQIPLTFQHFSDDESERAAWVETANPKDKFDLHATFIDTTGMEFQAENTLFVNPGIYTSVENLIDEINNLDSINRHLRLSMQRGGFVKISRVCQPRECATKLHLLGFSDKIWGILGFEEKKKGRNYVMVKDYESVLADRPANLAESFPTILMVNGNILEPYITGDVQSRLLRAVPLDVFEYHYGITKVRVFSPAMYLPLLITTFQAIEIDIRDQLGRPIPFSHGTLTVTLHFKRVYS